MNRNELITAVKENGIATERPAHMMKTEELAAVVAAAGIVEIPAEQNKPTRIKEGTLKARILELGKEGLTKHEIVDKCKEEGFQGRDGKPVRYVYVHVVLQNAGIEVPKEVRKKVILDQV